MSLALSKGTCGRTFGMANQSGGRAILCRRRASGRHPMDKTGRKTGNQWATKAGNDKEDTYIRYGMYPLEIYWCAREESNPRPAA